MGIRRAGEFSGQTGLAPTVCAIDEYVAACGKRNALTEGDGVGLSLFAEGIYSMRYPSRYRSRQDDVQA
jgi:hypothetical protein